MSMTSSFYDAVELCRTGIHNFVRRASACRFRQKAKTKGREGKSYISFSAQQGMDDEHRSTAEVADINTSTI
jgi:hypothetical protein